MSARGHLPRRLRGGLERRHLAKACAAGAMAAGIVAASTLAPTFGRQLLLGLVSGSVFGLLAMAMVLAYRTSGIVNFAQGEMATVSTFVAWSMMQRLGSDGPALWIVFAATLLAAFALGAAIEFGLLRRAGLVSPLHGVIFTVGLFSVMNGLAGWQFGHVPKPFPTPFGSHAWDIGEVTLSAHSTGVLIVAMLAGLAMLGLTRWTQLGSQMEAVGDDPEDAGRSGVPVDRVRNISWALSALVGATAGFLLAHTIALSPLLMLNVLVFALAGAVLGGLESPLGALVGGIVVGVGLNVVGTAAVLGASELRVVWAFLVIVVVLLLRPEGLFGRTVPRSL